MKMRIYAIYDQVAEESGPLFEAKNDFVAKRIYHSMEFPKGHSELEYVLLCLGEYDRESTTLLAFEKPLSMTHSGISCESEDEQGVKDGKDI